MAVNPEANLDQARRDRESLSRSLAARRHALRDIGDTPKIVDLERRESCRLDFGQFCQIYNPAAFYLEWAEIHHNAIARIEECVLRGAIYAYALPRGSGKSTLAKMAALWAISYGHRKYVFMVGATAEKAINLLGSIKTWMRFNKAWIEDFPEISLAVSELNGRGNSASSQLQNGESTLIGWSKDAVVMPTVQPPPNFPFKNHGLDAMPEFAVTSGLMIGTSGLTGDGIRGSVVTTRQGHELRPDLVLADDPQTDQSAKSPTQNQMRYDLMTGAVLGMAGPDKKLSLLMPCTQIKQGDMVSGVLDRKRNPLFRGQTTSILTEMPHNMDLWEEYFQKYQWCALQEPPDFTLSNQFYIDNQESMDEGCRATWPERFFEDEISGVQHAMNLYVRDPKTFWSEYMNQPKDESNDVIFLTADEITKKQHNYGRLEVPLEVQKVTAFIDVQKELLFYAIVGWGDKFDGYILDYGTFPKQHRITFQKSELPKMLSEKYPLSTEDNRIYSALLEFLTVLNSLQLKRHGDDKVMEIDAIGVDRGYKPTTIKKFVRDSRMTKVVPMYGGKWTGTEKPINHPDNIKKWTSGGRRLGQDWRLGDAHQGVQSIEHNPNFWKTRVQEALATPTGDPGSLSLFKDEPYVHQLMSMHLTSSFREQVTSRHGLFDVWKLRPGVSDDDFFDCIVGNSILASYLGISTTGVAGEEFRRRRKKVDIKKWKK